MSSLIRSIALVTAVGISATAQAQVIATGSTSGGQNRYYSIDINTGSATALSSLPTPVLSTTTAGLGIAPDGTPFGIAVGQLVRPDLTGNTIANLGPIGRISSAIRSSPVRSTCWPTVAPSRSTRRAWIRRSIA